MQKGGTIGLLLVVFGILAVTMWGGYHMFKADPEPERAPTPLVEVQPEGAARKTRSYVILDNSFALSGGFVYCKSGTDSAGESVYSIVRNADGQDANNVYNNGPIVDGVSVYLIGGGGNCDDTPVLISA